MEEERVATRRAVGAAVRAARRGHRSARRKRFVGTRLRSAPRVAAPSAGQVVRVSSRLVCAAAVTRGIPESCQCSGGRDRARECVVQQRRPIVAPKEREREDTQS